MASPPRQGREGAEQESDQAHQKPAALGLHRDERAHLGSLDGHRHHQTQAAQGQHGEHQPVKLCDVRSLGHCRPGPASSADPHPHHRTLNSAKLVMASNAETTQVRTTRRFSGIPPNWKW